ncbi:PH domain-containing protein [Gordonia sp. ABSL1-1]|uniref:PH domain-containing protein n=1 Tax=Gordonia sp. ABSL1-1 TaxID=3053923 RepID=UPI002573392D|nr:PH domain-containing protein [Gordonia sp. ABSL1-1]MDL9935807.1 PH domain-containing protein [Gordonia sp. ABSL1-1]
MRWYAVAAAIVTLAIHITFGALLTIRDTGVARVGTPDQIALVLVGVVICGAILLFLRPRLRVGAAGVEVRNLVSERIFGWDEVRGLTYPDRGFGGQLELPHDEHVPVLAVQAGDGDRAVEAMNRYREIEERYRG